MADRPRTARLDDRVADPGQTHGDRLTPSWTYETPAPRCVGSERRGVTGDTEQSSHRLPYSSTSVTSGLYGHQWEDGGGGPTAGRIPERIWTPSILPSIRSGDDQEMRSEKPNLPSDPHTETPTHTECPREPTPRNRPRWEKVLELGLRRVDLRRDRAAKSPSWSDRPTEVLARSAKQNRTRTPDATCSANIVAIRG